MEKFTDEELNELDAQIEAQQEPEEDSLVEEQLEEEETIHYDINGHIVQLSGYDAYLMQQQQQLNYQLPPMYNYPHHPRRNACHKWPECPYGDSCRYYHPGPTTVPVTAGQFAYGRENPNWRPRPPGRSQQYHQQPQQMFMLPQQYPPIRTQLCRNFPDCAYGDNCRYIHPQGLKLTESAKQQK